MSKKKTTARSSKTTAQAKTNKANKPTTGTSLVDRVLSHIEELGVRLSSESLDTALSAAERESLSHLEFLERLLSPAASARRERRVERRVREARFADAAATLETFDWKFNPSINRVQLEELATTDFVRRGENLVFVGQSGLGKSHLIQALGQRACLANYRVLYTTSASLLQELGASLADGTTPKLLRWYARWDLLIIDEFGFDHLERSEQPQAAPLLYKVIDGRLNRSTALVTNLDFESWGDYLGDAPLAMALLDRLVDGALIVKLKGKSYRASRAKKS